MMDFKKEQTASVSSYMFVLLAVCRSADHIARQVI